MSCTSCITSHGGTTSEAIGPFLCSHSIQKIKRFLSHRLMPNHESNSLKMKENWTSKMQTISITKASSENKVISNSRKHRSMVMVQETTLNRLPLPKMALITCTIIQQMIKIAMRICVEAIKVGWTNALVRVTILVIITLEIRLQVLAYKFANRMWPVLVLSTVSQTRSQRTVISVFPRGGENIWLTQAAMTIMVLLLIKWLATVSSNNMTYMTARRSTKTRWTCICNHWIIIRKLEIVRCRHQDSIMLKDIWVRLQQEHRIHLILHRLQIREVAIR